MTKPLPIEETDLGGLQTSGASQADSGNQAGKPSRRIDLAFNGVHHWFGLEVCDTEEKLHQLLRSCGITDFKDDTIAYTDTWSLTESKKNGLGDGNCAGHMYLISGFTLADIAHESTHMALGILSRSGWTKIPTVTDKAPEVEEQACSLIGFIVEEVVTRVSDLATNSEKRK